MLTTEQTVTLRRAVTGKNKGGNDMATISPVITKSETLRAFIAAECDLADPRGETEAQALRTAIATWMAANRIPEKATPRTYALGRTLAELGIARVRRYDPNGQTVRSYWLGLKIRDGGHAERCSAPRSGD